MNIEGLNIFPTPFWIIKDNILPDNIDEWVEEYQKNNRCIRRTNRKGYQSEAKSDLDDMPDEYYQYLQDKLSFLPSFYFNNWWLNVNIKGSYNTLHTHPMVDLAVIWYLTDNHGLLELRDPMLHTRWLLYDKIEQFRTYRVYAKAGDIVIFPADILHEVEEHTLDTPRVCISLNLKLTGKIGKPIY